MYVVWLHCLGGRQEVKGPPRDWGRGGVLQYGQHMERSTPDALDLERSFLHTWPGTLLSSNTSYWMFLSLHTRPGTLPSSTPNARYGTHIPYHRLGSGITVISSHNKSKILISSYINSGHSFSYSLDLGVSLPHTLDMERFTYWRNILRVFLKFNKIFFHTYICY